MRVVVADAVFDPNDQIIMLFLTANDLKNIATISKEGGSYLAAPDWVKKSYLDDWEARAKWRAAEPRKLAPPSPPVDID